MFISGFQVNVGSSCWSGTSNVPNSSRNTQGFIRTAEKMCWGNMTSHRRRSSRVTDRAAGNHIPHQYLPQLLTAAGFLPRLRLLMIYRCLALCICPSDLACRMVRSMSFLSTSPPVLPADMRPGNRIPAVDMKEFPPVTLRACWWS